MKQLWVTYLELRSAPEAARVGVPVSERIDIETLSGADYLVLYRRVGEPLRWDSRFKMPSAVLDARLAGGEFRTYVVRAADGDAVGFCEFDRRAFPDIELTHFGVVPEAQGRGIGPRLLSTALSREWSFGAMRIWLHTDTWDHPAAVSVYQRAGFKVYDVRREPSEGL